VVLIASEYIEVNYGGGCKKMAGTRKNRQERGFWLLDVRKIDHPRPAIANS